MLLRPAFSLIELLIVLSITSILVAIAVPNYREHLVNARRIQAKVALYTLATRIEEKKQLSENYLEVKRNTLGLHDLEKNIYYTLIIEKMEKNYFLISAIPNAQQAKQDSRCGKLSLDSKNIRYSSGADAVGQCW